MPCAHPMLPFGVTPHWGSQLLTPGTAAPREAPEQWIFLHEAALAAFLLLFWAAQPCLLAVSCLVRLKASRQLVRRTGQAWGCMFARDFLCRRCPGGLCCLDDDQMAPGADEPLAGARQPAGASSAFLAEGSGGRGINLFLAVPCMSD